MTDASTDHVSEGAQSSVEPAREATAKRLAKHATSGNLTLDEYAERVAAVERAASTDELEAAARGLSDQAGSASRTHRGRWLVGIFGGTDQRGRWRLSSRLRIVALLGGVGLNLGNAQPEASESIITIVAFLGGVKIIAPPGVPIEFTGLSVLGGKSDERAGGPALPGAPLVRLRVVAVLGGVKVKDRSPRRSLVDAIKGRRAKAAGVDR
jgi:hypothetical protein